MLPPWKSPGHSKFMTSQNTCAEIQLTGLEHLGTAGGIGFTACEPQASLDFITFSHPVFAAPRRGIQSSGLMITLSFSQD